MNVYSQYFKYFTFFLKEFCLYDESSANPDDPVFETFQADVGKHNNNDLAWPYKKLIKAYMVNNIID